MNVTEAAENYLEAILVLSRQKAQVHAVDVCTELGFSRPTVSVMLRKMKESGLIHIDEEKHLTLTEEGLAVAERTLERHNVLSEALMRLGVERSVALQDACKIEHDISVESFEAIKKHLYKS